MTTTLNIKETKLQHFESEGAILAYRIIGEGPPLLLVHGWPVFSYTWRFVLPRLTQHFTCYVVDLPGLGESKWEAKTNFNWKIQAKRILQFIDTKQLREVSILAQNSGGAISRLVAMKMKSKLKNLILINTEVPNHRPPWIPLYQQLSKLPLTHLSFKLLMKSPLFLKSSMGFKGFYYDKSLMDDPDYIMPYVTPVLQSTKKMKGAMKYLIGCDLKITDTFVERHREIEAKVLLLWGDKDPTFPIQYGKEMSKQFRDCTFVEIENAGLMPQEERPEKIVDEIIKFIS